jgi:tetraacyldisaccharide 4'-kinase
MPAALQRAWLDRGLAARLLWPLSQLYRGLAALHGSAYRSGLLPTARLAVPVIVVGNVVAGGAGKTPVVLALLEHLRARGLRAGVIARGYGRRTADCREVLPDSTAQDVGDEPLLVRRRAEVPVFVAHRRAEAGRALLAAHPGTQLLVSDDGLQHHALHRDVEICVFDARGIGNGWLLPAGPLRESWPRPADLVLAHGEPHGISGFTVQRRLAGHATRADGSRCDLAALRGQPVVAVAGIANPDAFFSMLREQGLQVTQTIALPDHDPMDRPLPFDGAQPIVCTEKDAAKLWRRYPLAWAVRLDTEIDPAAWRALDSLLDAQLSLMHGPQAA